MSPRVSVNVTVNALLDAEGNTVCEVKCGAQQAKVTFTGSQVIAEVPEPAPAGEEA